MHYNEGLIWLRNQIDWIGWNSGVWSQVYSNGTICIKLFIFHLFAFDENWEWHLNAKLFDLLLEFQILECSFEYENVIFNDERKCRGETEAHGLKLMLIDGQWKIYNIWLQFYLIFRAILFVQQMEYSMVWKEAQRFTSPFTYQNCV